MPTNTDLYLETRPKCLRCQRSGFPCAGYPNQLPFVHENAKLYQRYGHDDPAASNRQKQSTYQPEAVPATNHFTSLATDNPSPQGLALQLRQISKDNGYRFSVHAPDLQQQQLFSIFMDGLSHRTEPFHSSTTQSYRRWSNYLFSLHGKHPLLDASIRATSLAYVGRQSQCEKLCTDARQYYSQALRCLSGTLAKEGASVSCETLSATILLGFCEIFLASKQNAWIRHAGGAGALMRLRGPAKHRYGVGREIFLLYRNYLVIEAYFRVSECFLSQPDWVELSQQICDDICDGKEDAESNLFRFYTAFVEQNAYVTGIFADARDLTARAHQLGGPQAARDDIETRSRNSLKRLNDLFNSWTESLRKDGSPRLLVDSYDSIFPKYYHYINATVAAAYCSFYSIVIFLNQVIQEINPAFRQDAAVRKTCYQAAIDCCRSAGPLLRNQSFTEFMSYMPLRQLRICLVAFPPESKERSWVLNNVQRLHNGPTLMRNERFDQTVENPRPGIRKSVEQLEQLELRQKATLRGKS